MLEDIRFKFVSCFELFCGHYVCTSLHLAANVEKKNLFFINVLYFFNRYVHHIQGLYQVQVKRYMNRKVIIKKSGYKIE